MIQFTVAIAFNRYEEIANNLQPEADLIARETVEAALADYRANARIDTGAQVASAYLVTERDSTYAQAASAAHSANEAVHLLPEVAAIAHTAIGAVAVGYAVHNEYGVHGRAGDGAFTQAFERQRQPYNDRMRSLIERAARR